MQIDSNSEKPIFVQLAEELEDHILKGIYAEETQIPSTTEVAVILKINPATINRGVNLLVEEGIVYKKRGIGMFVRDGAKEIIAVKRKKAFFHNYIVALIEEAKTLGLTEDDIISLIKDGRDSNDHH